MSEIKIIPGLLSDLYHVFSAPRRCYAIQLLSQLGCEEYAVRELAREITAIEEGISKDNASGEPYRNVYNALSQTHLSTLENANLVRYNNQRQTVIPRPCLPRVGLILNLDLSAYLLLIDQSTEAEALV